MITESAEARSSTIVVVAAAVALLSMGVGLWFARSSEAPPWEATIFYPEPRPIDAFELTAADGTRFNHASLEGEWDLVFFGFTHCPDICPNTLSVLRDTNRLLEERGLMAPRVTLVSVDPERDQLEVMRDYVAFFDSRFRAATGDEETLARFALNLGAAFFVEPHAPGTPDYTVDHSAAVMIVDPEGRLRGQLRPPPAPESFARDLARLISS